MKSKKERGIVGVFFSCYLFDKHLHLHLLLVLQCSTGHIMSYLVLVLVCLLWPGGDWEAVTRYRASWHRREQMCQGAKVLVLLW